MARLCVLTIIPMNIYQRFADVNQAAVQALATSRKLKKGERVKKKSDRPSLPPSTPSQSPSHHSKAQRFAEDFAVINQAAVEKHASRKNGIKKPKPNIHCSGSCGKACTCVLSHTCHTKGTECAQHVIFLTTTRR